MAVGAQRGGRLGTAHEGGDVARDRGDVRLQLGVEDPVGDGVVAHDVDDRAACPSRIVQVGEAVAEPGSEMEEGRRLFVAVGCATCHMPSLGGVQGIFSDLLLHDMGQSLSDSGMYYGVESPGSFAGPSAQEWRTPPLWGYRDSGPYLHDGRAQNLEQVVALHEGQAR